MKKSALKDIRLTVSVLVLSFTLCLILRGVFEINEQVTAIFVFAVFLVSLLTQTEYNIVALLSEHLGKMMTYSAIIKTIWGDTAHETSIKKLQVNMANIRKKLGSKPGENNYIKNELGVGYRME